MAQEQELKLAVAPCDWPRIMDWLETLHAEQLPRQWLNNTYFDTPEGELNRQRVALRIRRSGAEYVQTLKTKGSASHGLHDRQEWDWPLTSTELDIQALASSPVADVAVKATLRPAFSTDFERLAWLWREGGQCVEIALDRGEVQSNSAVMAISEVELELKTGTVSGLIALAQALSRICPVFLNPVSKAELGYYLGGLYRPEIATASPEDSESTLIDAWIQSLGFYALTGQQDHLHRARAVFATLANRSAQLAPMQRPTADQFRELLTYQQKLAPGTADEARAQLLQNPLLGIVQLILIQR